ncbi:MULTISPECIES: helix-turn-helix domain-containing protein [Burkholderia]|jgi:transcriptional regulator with XRE-family HTH domain|uniref:Helix-turn-helix domain-containing protein n=2 Tax=Burkholderia contaminans TaxID=488447 RepID=A0A1E3FY17_9BURK|nr:MULTISPECIES: helix-turn-helix transcriptional regulator [Burkholderia]UTP25418.1 helix-turn-helix domain-containing protein [Burkholderia sp. FXe9]KKL32966.1 XRE family transcriptional regulator [Burkholderia contaminans LMG 23361]MBA9827651.1 XRE family transcriptional regulator [Burkholderia contaminans]MBA9836338.1 XRE family transcriptional regulator [Burkholderia contaminans]MBA9860844.1 XRE family transcriptional regulator [Burkholderia contaminans]
MTETAQLIDMLKRQLKAQGMTYRDVARALDVSETSVKRLFASGRFTLERVVEISQLLGYTLAELVQEASASAPRLRVLTEQQEALLVSDDKLLLVAVCAINYWTVEDIVSAYQVTKAECVKYLLMLDRMNVVALLPGDRIRVRVARDFDWLPGGPIRRYFHAHALGDFLDSRFDGEGETMTFSQGMLTEAASAELELELRRLRSKAAALHAESSSAPLAQKRGTSLLIAKRMWEPAGFQALRRNA